MDDEKEKKSDDDERMQKYIQITKKTIEKFLRFSPKVDILEDNLNYDQISILKQIWQFWKKHKLSLRPINNSAPYENRCTIHISTTKPVNCRIVFYGFFYIFWTFEASYLSNSPLKMSKFSCIFAGVYMKNNFA